MAGNGALFARADNLEATWVAVDRVLTEHHRAIPYEAGSWGPPEADVLIAADGGWHNPMPDET
jgi:glucose-6-phosphate 1-dehydrogenase